MWLLVWHTSSCAIFSGVSQDAVHVEQRAAAAADASGKVRSRRSSWNQRLAGRICHDTCVWHRACFPGTRVKILECQWDLFVYVNSQALHLVCCFQMIIYIPLPNKETILPKLPACAGTVAVCQKFMSARKQWNPCLETFGAHTCCVIISSVTAYKKPGRRQFWIICHVFRWTMGTGSSKVSLCSSAVSETQMFQLTQVDLGTINAKWRNFRKICKISYQHT